MLRRLLYHLEVRLDRLAEAVCDGVPVEDIDADGQVGLLEGLLQPGYDAPIHAAVTGDRQVEVGVLPCLPRGAGTERAHLATRHMFGQDPLDCF